MNPRHYCLIIVFLTLFSAGISDQKIPPSEKINGVNFVSPATPFKDDPIHPIKSIHGSWVSIIPFAFSPHNKPHVTFNSPRQWWGERTEGVEKTIEYARKHQMKVMIKPQVWNHEKGWMGEHAMENEQDWQEWEKNYTNYILHYVDIAQTRQVELFCIGTEFKLAVQERPCYWEDLINKIRMRYDGQLTYAANWDNYQNVNFWEHLDYIGIDAYFPLVDDITPEVSQLRKAWKQPASEIEALSMKTGKPVLFTEFGYRSIDRAAGKHWEIEDNWRYNEPGNLEIQKNAFQAIFEAFWNEPWFKGGFIWKWYPDHDKAGGSNNTDFTPQNKPVEEVIKHWFSKKY